MTARNKPYKEQRRLKAAMKLRGMTQQDVATRADLSVGYVTLLLNGFQYSESALRRIGTIVREKPDLA